MTKVYIVYFTEYEDMLEASFDENENMLDCWSPNDAIWRDYFNYTFKQLGIDVIENPEKNVSRRLQSKMKQYCEEQGWLND